VVTPKAEEILGVPPPVFVRKLVRASHWGGPEDQLQQRVSIAVGEVFRSDGSGTFSVYLVERDVDLHRVAIGMNGNRDSLMERLDLVAFSRQEMDAVLPRTNARDARRLPAGVSRWLPTRCYPARPPEMPTACRREFHVGSLRGATPHQRS
jgi:hypothetical protein